VRLTGDIRRNISYTAKTTLLQNEASAITAGTQAVRMSFEVPDEQRTMLLNITPRLGFNRWVPQPDGTVTGSVRPEQVPNDEPLAGCDGATSIILFQMDVIHGLTLSEIHPDAVTTAYGPPADFVTIARGEQAKG
jgi:homoserine dehydrogenase